MSVYRLIILWNLSLIKIWLMSQRKFLEDNENIQGEGRATRYAAS